MFTFSGPPIPSPQRGKGLGFNEYVDFLCHLAPLVLSDFMIGSSGASQDSLAKCFP